MAEETGIEMQYTRLNESGQSPAEGKQPLAGSQDKPRYIQDIEQYMQENGGGPNAIVTAKQQAEMDQDIKKRIAQAQTDQYQAMKDQNSQAADAKACKNGVVVCSILTAVASGLTGVGLYLSGNTDGAIAAWIISGSAAAVGCCAAAPSTPEAVLPSRELSSETINTIKERVAEEFLKEHGYMEEDSCCCPVSYQ